MGILEKFRIILLFNGILCLSLTMGVPSGRPRRDILIEETYPKIELYTEPQSTACPGRTEDYGIVDSGPMPAMPRTLSEDSILSKPLEEFVRSKRHTDHDESAHPVVMVRDKRDNHCKS